MDHPMAAMNREAFRMPPIRGMPMGAGIISLLVLRMMTFLSRKKDRLALWFFCMKGIFLKKKLGDPGPWVGNLHA
jgi:hypothetical protein